MFLQAIKTIGISILEYRVYKWGYSEIKFYILIAIKLYSKNMISLKAVREINYLKVYQKLMLFFLFYHKSDTPIRNSKTTKQPSCRKNPQLFIRFDICHG